MARLWPNAWKFGIISLGGYVIAANGSVLISGGHGASGTSNGAQLFSARNGAQQVASMLLPREGHACAALADGRTDPPYSGLHRRNVRRHVCDSEPDGICDRDGFGFTQLSQLPNGRRAEK